MLVRANAKINLTLDITGVLSTGYHTVEMIMQSVTLYDDIKLDFSNNEKINLRCSKPYLPINNRNVAYKAAEAFFDYTKIKNKGIYIKIYKQIPVSAGLAGGSADAAAVLTGLNEMFKTKLTMEELEKIAVPVGADIPFCLNGGTILAGGIGEQLTRLDDMPDCYIVLVKPPINVSTQTAYQKYNESLLANRPDTRAMIAALQKKDVYLVARNMCNVFEELVSLALVEKAKRKVMQYGALNAQMSGSGPTVIGIFDDKIRAHKCAIELRKNYREVHICAPCKNSVNILDTNLTVL